MGNTLALALKAGHTVHALARTPTKLNKYMSETHLVGEKSLDSNLSIIEGSITDSNAVRNTLLINDTIADIVIFGIGGAPQFNKSVYKPFTLDNPHICATGLQAVVDAANGLRCKMRGEIGRENKSLVVAISTTGISRKQNDVPVMLGPLYHWALAIPHADKRDMEDILASASVGSKGESKSPFGGVVAVRPTLLTDGEPRGLQKVKVGWEAIDEGAADGRAPATGYTISRADVGAWISAEIIENDSRMQWAGRAVTLAY